MPDYEVFESEDGSGGYSVESSEVILNGTGAGVLAPIEGSGSGLISLTGSGSGVLANITGSGLAVNEIIGTGAGVLEPIYGLGASGSVVAGYGAGTLRAITGSGLGSVTNVITGVGAGTLRAITGFGYGSVQSGTTSLPTYMSTQWAGISTPSLTLGDAFYHTLTLQSGPLEAPFDFGAATEIQVMIVSADHTQSFTDASPLTQVIEGSSWATGVLGVLIPDTITAEASSYVSKIMLAELEIQVTLSGYNFTWYAPIRLIPGYIT